MRKLFCLSLIVLLLVSCRSEEETWLERVSGLNSEEALAFYLKEAGTNPSPELMYNLAYTYIQLGNLEEALKTADDALMSYPGNIRLEYLKAYVLRESGRYYAYEEELELILRLDPGNTAIRELLYKRYASTGRQDMAVAHAKEALRRNPGDSTAMRTLARYIPFYAAIAGSQEETAVNYENDWYNPPSLYDFSKLLEQEERVPEEMRSKVKKPDSGEHIEKESFVIEESFEEELWLDDELEEDELEGEGYDEED